MMDKPADAQSMMERIMLGITHRDRKQKTWIRQETSLSDIINAIRKAKHRWAGHISRLSDSRWTIRATEWTPRDWTRKQGRPKTRWRDDLTRQQIGPLWSRLAEHRHLGDRSRRLPLSRVNTNHDDDDDDDDDRVYMMMGHFISRLFEGTFHVDQEPSLRMRYPYKFTSRPILHRNGW